MQHLYTLKKTCALYEVVMCMSKIVVFKSLSRKRCLEWIESNDRLPFNDEIII